MTSIVEYKGNLRTISTHLKSNEKIVTDAPIDNNGKGEAFSPTDMVANSVATCMLTIMGIDFEEAHKVFLEKVAVNCPVLQSIHPGILKRLEFVW